MSAHLTNQGDSEQPKDSKSITEVPASKHRHKWERGGGMDTWICTCGHHSHDGGQTLCKRSVQNENT